MKKFLEDIGRKYFSRSDSGKEIEGVECSVYVPQHYLDALSTLRRQREVIEEAVREYKSRGKRLKGKMKKFISTTLKVNETPSKLIFYINFNRASLKERMEVESFIHQAYLVFDNFKKWMPSKMSVMLNIPEDLEKKVDAVYESFSFQKEELEKNMASCIGRPLKKF